MIKILVRTKEEHGFPGKNRKIFLFLIKDLNGLPGFKFKPFINNLKFLKLKSSSLLPVPPITIVISDLLLLSSFSKVF